MRGDADGLSMLARMVWLYMRDEGGYWTSRELAEQLMPEAAPQTIGPALRALRLRGHIKQHPHGNNSWGVTTACSAPAGYALKVA